MATRLDGFYYARYEGMNPDGTAGQGVVVLKDGKVYGGDSASCFVGFFEERIRGSAVRTYRDSGSEAAGSWRLADGR